MNIEDVLKRRGYVIRQHIEEEGWGWRKLTVVDMEHVQVDALKHFGVPGLRKLLDEQLYRPPWGLFTFPSLHIEEPLPRRADVILARDGVILATIVAPADHAPLWAWAHELAAEIQQRTGMKLPIFDARKSELDLLDRRDVILLGGAHENALAMKLALRHRTFFADAAVPGDDGWLVTTHCGLNRAGHVALQVTSAESSRNDAAATLLDAIAVRGSEVVLRHTHHVVPGKVMAKHFPSFEKFIASLPARMTQTQGRSIGDDIDPASVSRLLALGLDSGGLAKNLHNGAYFDVTIDVARHYQQSSDRRSLALFRELLFRLTDYYLLTPGGASYPSDLDFRLGQMILYYARFEHDPIFDDEDRLILTNIFLSCSRAVLEYSHKNWPMSPAERSRHNHPTFKALTLLYASEYFSRFDLPFVKDWLAYSNSVMDCDVWTRIKMKENGRVYEPFVYEHAACHALFSGKGLSAFSAGVLERMTQRQITTTDNFFRAVDYGDTVLDMGIADSMTAALLAADAPSTPIGQASRWFVAEGFARKPAYLPQAFRDFPGIRTPGSSAAPASGDWEHEPLDPAFLRQVSPDFPLEYAFDKLALRTGWRDEDHYLLIEGVGKKTGHAHHEACGIVRLNHLSRHWVVSNGYGRRTGVTDVTKSFQSREIGPEDHNMLVLRQGEEVVRDLPMAALLSNGQAGSLHHTTTALIGYGGINWFRTVIVALNKYVLVLDRINVVGDGLSRGHIEWNLLGQATDTQQGCRLDQQGVFMDVSIASDWKIQRMIADQSACWKRVLGSGGYPYASFPLTKLLLHLPSTTAGTSHAQATLFAAHRGQPSHQLAQPEPGMLVISGDHEAATGSHELGAGVRVTAKQDRMEVRFDAQPVVPAPLSSLSTSKPR
jgi:hypothetical protein